MDLTLLPEARAILQRFGIEPAGELTPQAGGHVNAAWRVSDRRTSAGTTTPSSAPHFLLQRLNPTVFPDGDAVMHNLSHVTAHLTRAIARLGLPDTARRVLRLVLSPGGEASVRGQDGAVWRVFEYIGGARACDRAGNAAEATQVGFGFGLFQRLLADYAGPPLRETIPGFHDTARRVAVLERAAGRDAHGRGGSIALELDFVRARTQYAGVVPPLMADGSLPPRVVHNDAKSSNVLLDQKTGEALAVVDLDTVMPGTLLSDVGDLFRSMASPTDEDERDLGRIQVDHALVEGLVRGFLSGAGMELTETELRLLVFSGILLSYEQGVRFLTDYLEGDMYYRIHRPGQNLDRARAQFRLVECLEADRRRLEDLVYQVKSELR